MITRDVKVSVGGVSYELRIDPSDSIGRQVWQTRTPYEQDLLQVASELLDEGDVVLDVGSNVGNHAAYFSQVCRARVIAFEPNPMVLPIARANAESHGYELHEFGLGSVASRASVSVMNPENLGGAMVRVDPAGSVQLLPLDECDLPRPVRLIKLDIEGAEIDALKGAREVLRCDTPVLIVESHNRDVRREVQALLEVLGYRRLPVSLAATPTYMYTVELADLLRVIFSVAFVKRLFSRVLAASRWALSGRYRSS